MIEIFVFRPIINFFTSDSNRNYNIAFLLLITFLVSLFLILIKLGCPPINVIPWDIMIFLDGAWRVINGQIPNVDFSSVVPPLSILLTAFGMKVALPSAASIAYGNVLLFLVLTPWAWFIARNRLSAANAFMFAVFIGILLIAPRALGYDTLDTTYAMLYNRQGWVLISMLFVELFVSHRKTIQHGAIRSSLSTSLLLALLLFSKLSFFGIGLMAVLLHYFLFRPSIKRSMFLTISFLFVVIIMQTFLPLNLFAYISHMLFIASIYGKKRSYLHLLSLLINNSKFILITILSLLTLVNELDKTKEKSKNLSITRLLLTVSFVTVSGVMLCYYAAQLIDIPLFFIAGLICLEYLRQKFKHSDRPQGSTLELSYFYSILLIIPLLCGTILVKDVKSIAYSVIWHQSELSSISELEKFQSNTLSTMVIPKNSFSVAADEYQNYINDGLNLLHKHISNDSRIFALDVSNPFPFALELPPPEGGITDWAEGYTFNNQYFPDAEKAFKGANMVMIPKGKGKHLDSVRTTTVIAMKNLYKNYLDKHFIEKENSDYWTLLVKRN